MQKIFRYNEYKYTVQPHMMPDVERRLTASVGGTDPFPEGMVESYYFDTLDYRTLEQCVQGEDSKTKFRIRRYNDNCDGSLQIKMKSMYGVAKLKARLPNWKIFNDWNSACRSAQGASLPEIEMRSSGYPCMVSTVRICYRRRRFRFMDARITLDDMISAERMSGLRSTKQSYICLSSGVLEVKTASPQLFLPPFLKEKVEYSAFSKYELSCRGLLGAQT